MRVLVLYSGGRDSTCLLDTMVAAADAVWALHVNYGLRPGADDDQAHCAEVCERLGVQLFMHRAGAPVGNVQAWAREVRYAQAERLAAPRDALIATGHTATDQVETVLYRLAASPGRRALLGMPARSGRIIRPLLHMTREDTAAYCRERGLPWREDASNAASARGRIRDVILPALRELHPAADDNILRTLDLLRDEAVVLDGAVSDALRDEAAVSDAAAVRGEAAMLDAAVEAEVSRLGLVQPDVPGAARAGVDLAALPPALARLVLQRLADEAAGGRADALGPHTDAILKLARRPGTATLDLPGGLRAVAEYGRVRIDRGPATPPTPTRLPVPGRAAYGAGELTCERGAFEIGDGTLAAQALAPSLEVRPWRPGDRMRPLGLEGSRSLQDLFGDRKIPRERRQHLPVVLSDGEIAWVPGVATGERFRVRAATEPRVRLAWRLHSAPR